MSNNNSTTVLIVGAGPSGLTIANELFRHGINCRIIDKEAQASDKSRALAIHARTLELLENLGIAEQFVSLGWKLNAFNVHNQGRHIVRMSFSELESNYPFVLSLPQVVTERLLTDRLAKYGGTIERSTTLVALSQKSDQVIAIIQHSDGAEERLVCNYLVAADGAHSTVRKLLDVPFSGSRYPEYFVLADIEYKTALDTHEIHFFSKGYRQAGFHPFSPVAARIFADVDIAPPTKEFGQEPAHAKPDREPTLAELQEILNDRGSGLVKISKLNWLSMHSVHRRQVHSYRHGRVLFAGDAAHVHNPASGQGMNLGIQDGFNLGWKLALVEKGVAYESLLDSYGQERHEQGRRILEMTNLFSKINTLRNPLAQLARNWVGPVLSRQEGIARRYRNAVSNLSANYIGSPIVWQHKSNFHAGPAPGERAPDANLVDCNSGQPLRLFNLFKKPQHHLLLFAAADTKKAHALSEIAQSVTVKYGRWIAVHLLVTDTSALQHLSWTSSILRDPDGTMHSKYGATSPSMYLLRPDGYVAFRSLPFNKEELSQYLKSLFK